jgi:hypothetical protein
MTIRKETVLDALAAKLFALSAFDDTGRRIPPWGEITEMPALYLRSDADLVEWQGLNPRVIYGAQAWLFCDASVDPTQAPESSLNDLIGTIYDAFTPAYPMVGFETLGGLVQWCRIEGEILPDVGDGPDAKSKAVITFRILVP